MNTGTFELGESFEEVALALDRVRTGEMSPAVLLAACERAITSHPENNVLWLCYFRALTMVGDLTTLFQEIVRYYRMPPPPSWEPVPPNAQPMWDGSPLEGRTLLVYLPQEVTSPGHGYGDILQFGRYALLVKGRVVLVAPSSLHTLFMRSGFDVADSAVTPWPAHDVRVPVFALPGLLKLTEETCAPTMPYLVRAERKVGELLKEMRENGTRQGRGGNQKSNFPSSISTLKDLGVTQVQAHEWQKLAGIPEDVFEQRLAHGLRIGIVWHCHGEHIAHEVRSCPLQDLLPLFALPNVEWYSVQVGEHAQDIHALGLDNVVIDLTSHLHTFDETAALLAQLDLVITIDSAVAHLAGALGRPTFLLLPYFADWRWSPGSSTPFYPTMTLYRQTLPGSWADPVEALAAELATINVSP